VTETARILESSGHYTVLVTHRGDRFVPLADRVSIARKAKADLFLSVHADSLPREAMHGASIFTLSETASDNLAAAVAKQENSVDLLGGIRFQGQSRTVNDILLDLLQRETRNLSLTFAHALLLGLGKKVTMLPNSERAANFAVLRSPEIPSSLVEIGCLSNRDEERELVRPSYRRKIALALSHSIDLYFSQVT
jgi:N-acetylmuramoyl-L-alanine amidase